MRNRGEGRDNLGHVAVSLEPFLDVLQVALDVRNLGLDGVLALFKGLVVAGSVLVGKKGLNLGKLLLGSEAAGAQHDKAAEHGQARRQLLVDQVPLGRQVLQRGLGTLCVGAKAGDGVDGVLVLDVVGEDESQSPLYEGGVLGTAERTEGAISDIGAGRGAEDLEEFFIL